MTMTKILLFSGFLLLLSQCYNGLSRYISVCNNSDNPISWYMSFTHGIFYPDTTLPEKNPNPRKFDEISYFYFGEGLHENKVFAWLPTDTISIFFFDPDTLAKYDWAIIREEYKILVRYDLSHDNLRELKWCVCYPPTEAMQNMKMYPPYATF